MTGATNGRMSYFLWKPQLWLRPTDGNGATGLSGNNPSGCLQPQEGLLNLMKITQEAGFWCQLPGDVRQMGTEEGE